MSLLQLFLLYHYFPWESPRWLWINNKPEEASEILYYLYKPWVVEDVLKGFEGDEAARRNTESIISSGEHSGYASFRKP